jgi:TPR repeat protein
MSESFSLRNGSSVYVGRDLPRDVAEARSLWEQAAALGKINAMYNLGTSYLEGLETDRDPEKAEAWLRRAAEGGQPDAQRWLRSTGYAGTLPPPLNEAAMMSAPPKGVTGHTKVCGLLIS